MLNVAARKIAAIRRARKLTQADVAREIGKTRSWVNGAEKGRFRPGRELSVEIEAWSKGQIHPRDWDVLVESEAFDA